MKTKNVFLPLLVMASTLSLSFIEPKKTQIVSTSLTNLELANRSEATCQYTESEYLYYWCVDSQGTPYLGVTVYCVPSPPHEKENCVPSGYGYC